MPEDPSGQVAELLQRWVQGDEAALAAAVPVVYQSCGVSLTITSNPSARITRCRARRWFTRLTCGCSGANRRSLQNRAHFIAVASRLMRQILVDYARERAANKRDGGCGSRSRILEPCPSPGMRSSWRWTMR